MTAYRIVSNVGGVLLSLRSRYSVRQPWCRAKLRREATCQITGESIAKGVEAWRPVDNALNRSHRISADGMKQLLGRRFS